MNKKVI